jgi:exosortase/archaeosortase
LLFVPVFLAVFVLYLVILPYYEPLVMRTSNAITLQMTPPTHLKSTEEGWDGYVWSPEEGERRMRGWTPITAHLAYLSMVMLPALLLATPAPFLSRLRMLAISAPLIFITQVVSLVITTRGVYCLQVAPGTFYCLWALRIAYASGQIFAATLWVLLTWRYWIAASRTPRDAASG